MSEVQFQLTTGDERKMNVKGAGDNKYSDTSL